MYWHLHWKGHHALPQMSSAIMSDLTFPMIVPRPLCGQWAAVVIKWEPGGGGQAGLGLQEERCGQLRTGASNETHSRHKGRSFQVTQSIEEKSLSPVAAWGCMCSQEVRNDLGWRVWEGTGVPSPKA
jgi:hypothetical protein